MILLHWGWREEGGLGFRERERESFKMSGRLNHIFKLTCFYNLRLTRKPLDHSLVEIDRAFDRRGLFGKLPRLVYQIDLRKKKEGGVQVQ